MKKIYIAGPYTNGDMALNVRYAIQKADLLATLGFAPYVPHLCHFWHLLFPRSYDFWMELDKIYLECCDAVFRLKGESPGADEETAFAKKLKIPVFTDISELVEYFKNDNQNKKQTKRISEI